MKREMLKLLKDRYKHMESNEYYAIATLLDPREYFLHYLQQHWQNKCFLLHTSNWKWGESVTLPLKVQD